MLERSVSFKNWDPADNSLENEANLRGCSNKNSIKGQEPIHIKKPKNIIIPQPFVFFSPKPKTELDAAATTLQKVYKSYRTRRNLADCAVVVEELWWKALDFAALKRSSVSFFNVEKHETAASKWSRATTRAAKRCSVDDDEGSSKIGSEESNGIADIKLEQEDNKVVEEEEEEEEEEEDAELEQVFERSKRLECKWSSGIGARIGCVREYPHELQSRALEQVNLSPTNGTHFQSKIPIHSPRPTPKIRVSPTLSYMGLPSPRVSIST